MGFFKSFTKGIFSLNEKAFERFALELFAYQSINNPVYKQYLNHLNIAPKKVRSITRIPFLPISFFKSHEVKTDDWQPQKIFESSGTTGQQNSRHMVHSLDYYYQVCLRNFEIFYGPVAEYHIFALLPSYLERNNASLVFMMQHLITRTNSAYSGFYLHDYDKLQKNLHQARKSGQKVLLLGVTFALLDFAKAFPGDLKETIVMDTGGMKGRRKEMVREEVHSFLKKQWNLQQIHSEYGMTELMSQAYANADGQLKTPPWMRVLARDLNDPFDLSRRRTGGINIIDLANVHSCAFIETADIGSINKQNGSFEVLGRTDNSDIRGCNLMVI